MDVPFPQLVAAMTRLLGTGTSLKSMVWKAWTRTAMMRMNPKFVEALQDFLTYTTGGAGNPSAASCMARTQPSLEAAWALQAEGMACGKGPTCQPGWAHAEVELESTSLKFFGGHPNKSYLQDSWKKSRPGSPDKAGLATETS